LNINDPTVQRGRKRLAALGIDPDADLDEIKAWYESERARYIHLAENGLHMAPTHAVFGMTTQALASAFGWSDLPADWSPARVQWPTATERQNGATGR
jgi:hypothetical protein